MTRKGYLTRLLKDQLYLSQGINKTMGNFFQQVPRYLDSKSECFASLLDVDSIICLPSPFPFEGKTKLNRFQQLAPRLVSEALDMLFRPSKNIPKQWAFPPLPEASVVSRPCSVDTSQNTVVCGTAFLGCVIKIQYSSTKSDIPSYPMWVS